MEEKSTNCKKNSNSLFFAFSLFLVFCIAFSRENRSQYMFLTFSTGFKFLFNGNHFDFVFSFFLLSLSCTLAKELG